MENTYIPYITQEVAIALGLSDCEDISAHTIAEGLLSGKTKLSKKELKKLAVYKSVTIDYLTEHDPAFEIYIDPIHKIKKDIASVLIDKGQDAEFAADVCGLTLDDVMHLLQKRSVRME